MSTFGTQMNHEMKSISLQTLVQNKSKILHLLETPVTLANYRLDRGWFSNTIAERFKNMEMLPMNDVLRNHLAVNLSDVKGQDQISMSVYDANVILRLL